MNPLRLTFLACVIAAAAGAAPPDEPAASPNLRHYYPLPDAQPRQTIEADVCVYGGTSGGVTAALQAARMGKKAVLVEFGRRIGGLTTGGLSATDGGSAAGGIAREFYTKVGQSGFKPARAEQAFRDMLRQSGVPVFTEHRLVSVKKDGNRLAELRCENGNVFRAKVFIDCTYEGDLLAAAGVSFHVGREANSVYNETLNGIFAPQGGHQFTRPVDPYRTPGDPSSGLLWGISRDDPGKKGEGDRRVQAYNFRMFLVRKAPGQNVLPFPRPQGYDPSRYELLLRYIAAGGGPGVYPHAGDNNNNGAFSTDNIGRNYDWPDGAARGDPSATRGEAYFRKLYETREVIFQDHVTYQQGLIWFVTHDPRAPQKLRDELANWGLPTDSFTETGGWPHALYVREGRRMVSDFVMTEHHCRGTDVVEDPVGLAQYNMDSHNCQRYVAKDPRTGKAVVRNEGDVQVRVPGPYPVAYRALVPRERECANLLVPVCLSSSHIAYGSIRMEPVFMVLGQSAATAACMAIDAGVAVQKVDYAKLKERLLADKQMLVWTGPRRAASVAGIDAGKLPGTVVDDKQAELTGEWAAGHVTPGFVGDRYLHDNAAGKAAGRRTHAARFVLPVKEAGTYEVRMSYPPNPNRATNVPVTVSGFEGAEGAKTVRIDQRKMPPIDKLFFSLGTFRFEGGATAVVELSNEGADGHVLIDAVQVLPAAR